VHYGFNLNENKFRYSLTFRDSMLILKSSLEILSKAILNEQPELQKNTISGKSLIKQILRKPKNEIKMKLQDEEFIMKFKDYCIQDCISLWHIINNFNKFIFSKYHLNVHSYPTLPSLALAILRSHFLKENEIPKIIGDNYKFLKHSYTGGKCDVYHLYSNKECRLYDFVNLYPSVMMNEKFPVGLVNRIIGKPFQSGLMLNDLYNNNILSFINCDIFVDNSINRPVYQTKLTIPNSNSIRTMSATGIFKNQWIFLPELIEYQKLTNNKNYE